jgi:hypothetical protein
LSGGGGGGKMRDSLLALIMAASDITFDSFPFFFNDSALAADER